MRLSEKGLRQAKAIEHYEAALMMLYPVRGEAWEHWNEARKILVNAEISDPDYVNSEKQISK